MIADQFAKTPWVPQVIPTYVHPEYTEKWKFDQLEQKVRQIEEFLRAAKKYDDENGEPECELETKKEALRALAKQWGVEINLA